MSFTQTYPIEAQPATNHAATAPFSLLSAIWAWLGIVSRHVLGRGVIHGDTPPTPFVSRVVNRAQRRLYNHHPNSPLPPSRNLTPFYAFGPRVSPTQFLERLCRLSVRGRVIVYRMVFWSPRLVREAFMALFSRGTFRQPSGLCEAHLVPD
ncbi:hypothetical protein [Fretibacter rubidus]|uniref:hypothetical protein n=1 Tax=Fretibacter rubidus TaxID=570162 RepID=UPI00352BA342